MNTSFILWFLVSVIICQNQKHEKTGGLPPGQFKKLPQDNGSAQQQDSPEAAIPIAGENLSSGSNSAPPPPPPPPPPAPAPIVPVSNEQFNAVSNNPVPQSVSVPPITPPPAANSSPSQSSPAQSSTAQSSPARSDSDTSALTLDASVTDSSNPKGMQAPEPDLSASNGEAESPKTTPHTDSKQTSSNKIIIILSVISAFIVIATVTGIRLRRKYKNASLSDRLYKLSTKENHDIEAFRACAPNASLKRPTSEEITAEEPSKNLKSYIPGPKTIRDSSLSFESAGSDKFNVQPISPFVRQKLNRIPEWEGSYEVLSAGIEPDLVVREETFSFQTNSSSKEALSFFQSCLADTKDFGSSSTRNPSQVSVKAFLQEPREIGEEISFF